MLEFNLFGIPYVGADICGFFGKASKDLCARWSSLGAFYPFSRNHNGIGEPNQDPGFMGEPVISAARDALHVRYTILPYYYTLFHKAHTRGTTVIRPLHHEFPTDARTYPIDGQFLVGPALLITPVLEEHKVTVTGYFPADNWYDYHTGAAFLLEGQNSGENRTLAADLNFIPIHVRGGFILPTQEPDNTTFYARLKPFGLIVAPNVQGEAVGDLYYDDGESELDAENGEFFEATFELRNSRLTMSVEHNRYPGMDSLVLDTIRVFVANAKVVLKDFKFYANSVLINGAKVVLENDQVTLKGLNLAMNKNFEVTWGKEEPSVKAAKTWIDCSLKGFGALNKDECEAKKCRFNQDTDGRPHCVVNEGYGGYTIVDEMPNKYALARADKFELVEGDRPVEKLNVVVGYGVVDGRFRMANIKVSRLRVETFCFNFLAKQFK